MGLVSETLGALRWKGRQVVFVRPILCQAHRTCLQGGSEERPAHFYHRDPQVGGLTVLLKRGLTRLLTWDSPLMAAGSRGWGADPSSAEVPLAPG